MASSNDSAARLTAGFLALKDDAQAVHLARFFKTAPGQYGAGDHFLGIKVPVTRGLVKPYISAATLADCNALLDSEWHEIRLAALLLMVGMAEYFIDHPHDLMHKASGWMLREAGKIDRDALRAFLAKFHKRLPRTALRYAIERMDAEERRRWMAKD